MTPAIYMLVTFGSRAKTSKRAWRAVSGTIAEPPKTVAQIKARLLTVPGKAYVL
jgi:hypothetical protein